MTCEGQSTANSRLLDMQSVCSLPLLTCEGLFRVYLKKENMKVLIDPLDSMSQCLITLLPLTSFSVTKYIT